MNDYGTLVLGMEKGDSFYVGDTLFTVTEIETATKFSVSTSTTQFLITDQHDMQVMDNPPVYIGAGNRSTKHLARVKIRAPREVNIVREQLTRNRLRSPYGRVRNNQS